ncbi:serine hydrolase [Phenylobacterium sp.]|uniref:serine hydrolase domain-containing protein n=1 Tax=Phenylobacterium sp. TaxID=1871053 RepID=UPI00273063D7|nr:serine hydrolase [Phenylobacterium sp.]MDP1616236.1 serine hydrolase [Phenylobacterium sp.]MDP1985768.1 serine hydrolase [Phenylobacterium sp.]
MRFTPSRQIAGALALGLLGACSPAPAPDRAQAQTTDAPAPAAVQSQGLDPVAMARVVEQARALPNLHAVIVARDGEVLAEHRLRGAGLDQPVNIKSASKTVLSALVGIAIDRGVLTGPDQKIAPLLAANLPSGGDPRLQEIEVGHLLSMQAGLGRTSGQYYGAWVTSPNWVRHALARPFDDDPGGRMIYSTGTSHLMSAALTRAAGASTHTLARDWLAQPLGVAIPPWLRDPQGIYFGGNDMMMSPRDLLRFGELYRLGGEIDGRRIVSAEWIEASWTPRTRSPWSGHDYGYGWFTKQAAGHPVHFAWGYGGQMLFVVPSLDLTVVMISDPSPRPREESHVSQLHALLDAGIIPAAIAGERRPPSPSGG